MSGITRKNSLAMNLRKMSKIFPEDYDFYPKTWLLPSEYSDLKNQLSKKQIKAVIIKPEASAQGNGIYLTNKLENRQKYENCIAQEYIISPFLIDGLKFDFRIYALVTGINPPRIFIYEEGLARFATEEYKIPSSFNKDEACMHLTNYSINKYNSKFQQPETEDGETGHKRSMSSVL